MCNFYFLVSNYPGNIHWIPLWDRKIFLDFISVNQAIISNKKIVNFFNYIKNEHVFHISSF